MIEENKLDILESLVVKNNIPYDQLKIFSHYCYILNYDKDEIIYSKKIKFKYVGIIIDGEVGYFLNDLKNNKKKIKLASFKKYPVGMFNFLELNENNFSIKATKKTKIIAIKYSDLKNIEDKIPSFAAKLYKSFIKLNMQINKRLTSIIANLATK